MKRSKILFCIFLIIFFGYGRQAEAQLMVSNSLTPLEWVQQVLIGPGITVSNVTYTGDPMAGGTFSGASSIGFTGGVILTSGSINNAPGPNNSGSAGTTLNPGNGDPTLSAINGTVTTDACILEFDFVPICDTVQFRFVFGSEEYLEWVGSSFNDVFAFLLSGPGINGPYTGAENLAVVPASNIPITINTINNASNPAYYVNNPNPNTNSFYIQYDGYTVPMVAKHWVQAGQTYHIKLAIADGTDHAYDSGVFLEENSFTSNMITVNLSWSNPPGSNSQSKACIEGCRNSKIRFYRPVSEDDTTYIRIDSITGTAIHGVDYTVSPNLLLTPDLKFDSVMVLPHTSETIIEIIPLYDGIPEPTDTVFLNLSLIDCVAGADTAIIIPIFDYSHISLDSINNDTSLCEGQLQLFAYTSGGAMPLSYLWSPTQTLSNPLSPFTLASPTESTMYYLQIQDSTRCSLILDSVMVNYSLRPVISFKPEPFTGCDSLTVQFLNNTTPAIQSYLWDFGDGSSSTLENPVHVFHYNALDPTYTVKLTAATSAGCQETYTVNNLITVFENVDAGFNALPDSTSLDNPLITFENTSSPSATHYQWNFADSLNSTSTDISPTFTYLSEGLYTVWLYVSTDNGCKDSVSHDVKVVKELALDLTIPNIITPNGDGKNDKFVITNVENYPQTQLLVFDRWGRKVYDESPYLNNWDGDNLADGVYFIQIRYKRKGKIHSEDGTLTIIR